MTKTLAREQTFSFDGKTTDYYWVLGDRKNPAFLFIPGYTGTHGDLLAVADELTKKYFVIIPDLPGWGKSPRFAKTLSIHNYATYLKSLLQKEGVSRLTVCGHCMGATLAIEFTYLYQDMVKELFLFSTPYLEGTLSHRMFLHLADWTEKSPKSFREVFFFWRMRIFTVPLDFYFLKMRSFRKKVKLALRHLLTQPQQPEDSVEEAWISLVRYDYEKVKKITIPVHIIHGFKDPMVSAKQAEAFHNLLPSATFDLLLQSGHCPPLETPKTMATAILKYK
ncbi:MAG: alpha/beta fold hydrolase [Candidatus Levyibacteriota bacterium]